MRRLILAMVVLVLGLGSLPARATTYMSTTVQCGNVGITNGVQNLLYTVYSVTVNNVVAGDEYLIIGEMQARNDATYNVEFMAFFTATENRALPCAAYDNSFDGLIGVLNAHNVTPNPGTHYANPHHSYIWRAPNHASYVVFAYRARARSSLGTGSQNMPVQPGQGFLQVRKLN